MQSLPQDDIDRHILSYIKYTAINGDRLELSGLQMIFENRAASPFYEGYDTTGLYSLQHTIDIDTSREIRYASMLVGSGLFYHGLRLLDDA